MEGRIRQRDIAERLGMDKSTVSLALRGHPRIPEATRQRVRALAEALGYVPDPALSRLAHQRWARSPSRRTVSIALLNWSGDDYPDQSRELLGPVRRAIEELGYGFERAAVKQCGGAQAAARMLEARGVAGLVVMASRDPAAWTDFPWQRFCGVEVLSGAGRPSGLSVIRQDTFGSLLDAGGRVAQARPRSAAICLLQQRPPSLTDDRDEAAALLVLNRWQAAGIACRPVSVFKESPDFGRELIDWLKREAPEIAILPNPAFSWMLGDARLRVPDDLRVILHRRHGSADMAGYEQQTGRIGQLAAQYIDSLLRTDRRGLPASPETSVVPARWVPGPSF